MYNSQKRVQIVRDRQTDRKTYRNREPATEKKITIIIIIMILFL